MGSANWSPSMRFVRADVQPLAPLLSARCISPTVQRHYLQVGTMCLPLHSSIYLPSFYPSRGSLLTKPGRYLDLAIHDRLASRIGSRSSLSNRRERSDVSFRAVLVRLLPSLRRGQRYRVFTRPRPITDIGPLNEAAEICQKRTLPDAHARTLPDDRLIALRHSLLAKNTTGTAFAHRICYWVASY